MSARKKLTFADLRRFRERMAEADEEDYLIMSSEYEIQKALVEWAAYKRREIPALRMLFHVPMGGYRSRRSGARMKKLGARKGVPDLVLPVMRPSPSGGIYGALWLEMKGRRGRLTKEQKEWRRRLIKEGYAYRVCRSWIEGRNAILKYLSGELLID